MRHFLAVGLIAVAGCAGVDRPLAVHFEPIGSDRFRYQVTEMRIYGDDIRTTWLRQTLDENNMCPNGYVIEDEKVGKVGAKTDIILYGRCT